MTILCLIACMAWIVGLTWMVLCPIERDRQLSHGKVKNLLLVVCAIITLPLVLTFLISRIDVEPEELVFDDGMYQKWQPYSFQKDVDSTSYSIAKGTLTGSAQVDTAVIYSPKSYRERQMDKGNYEDPSLAWTVYYQFVNPSRQNMATTLRGRWIAFCLSMLGMILMTGLLVSLTSNFFQRRIERWRNGQIRYTHGLGRFCVVIGANKMLASTLKQIDDNYDRLQHIIVLTNRNIPELRKMLVSELPKDLEKKIVLYSGKLDVLEEVKKLRCKECDEVFILGEDPSNSSGTNERTLHDTQNIKCMNLIAESLKQRAGRLRIHVLLNDASTYSVFQVSDLQEALREKIEFIPFNINETWARKVLVENVAGKTIYEPLDTKDGINKESDKYVHLVVAGMTDMGIAMAVEAAHIAHYPNFNRNHNLKTIITFIDKNIKQKEIDFKARYRTMFDLYEEFPAHLVAEGEDRNFLDVEWEFIEGDLKDKDFQYQCVELRCQKNTLMTLALCYDDAEEVLLTAMCLSPSLYEKCVQLLAYQPESYDTINILAHKNKACYNKIRPFGITKECVDLSDKFIPMSKLVNYAYSDLEDIKLEKMLVDKDGNYHDNVTEEWNKQSTVKKWSNTFNSDSIPTKLRSIGCSDWTKVGETISKEDIATISEVEHRRWNMEELLLGFRTLTYEEQEKCRKEILQGSNRIKKEWQNDLMAHMDICSLDRLKEINPGDVGYDEKLTAIIPAMVREHLKDRQKPCK